MNCQRKCKLLTVKAIATAMLLLGAVPLIASAQGSGYLFNDQAKTLYAQAKVFLSSNHPAQAVPLLEKASALAPYSFEIYQALGIAYQNSNISDKAIFAYQKALIISPQQVDLLIHMAECYKNMNQFDPALTYYDKYLDQNPTAQNFQQITVERLHVSGLLLYQQEKYAAAQEAFEQVIASNPNDASAHFQLAVACTKCGDFEKAIPEFQCAYKLDNKLQEALLNTGTCYQVLGKAKEAVVMYKQYLRVDPKSNDARTIGDLITHLSQMKTANRSNNTADYLEDVIPNGHTFRWPSQAFPIRVYIAPGFSVPGYRNSFRDDFINALNDWAGATDERIGYTIVPSTGQANVICQWTNDPTQVSEDGNTSSGGVTKVQAIANDTTHSTSIDCVSMHLLTTSTTGTNVDDDKLKYVCLHEIGHMLGLQGHSGNNHDVMFYSELPSALPILSQRDKATILRLYQAYPIRPLNYNYEQFTSAF